MSKEEVTLISKNGFVSKQCAQSAVKEEEDSAWDATIKLESELIIIDSDDDEVYPADSPLSVNQPVSQEDTDPLSFLGECSVISINLKPEHGLTNGGVSEASKESERHESIEITIEDESQDFSSDVKQSIPQQHVTPLTSRRGSKVFSENVHMKSEQDLFNGDISSDEPQIDFPSDVTQNISGQHATLLIPTGRSRIFPEKIYLKNEQDPFDPGISIARENLQKDESVKVEAGIENDSVVQPSCSELACTEISFEEEKLAAVSQTKRKPVCNENQYATNSTFSLNNVVILDSNHTSSNNGQFFCDQCKIGFKDAATLNSHLGMHPDKPFSCPTCSARFEGYAILKRHLKTHKREKPFTCEKCSAQFETKFRLTLHFVHHHTSKKEFRCQQCSVRCKSLIRLKRHQAVHSDNKPYVCEKCSARFSRGLHLRMHKARHTAKEKRFSCELCSASFTTNSHLKRHSAIHFKDKLFRCNLCTARFLSETGLSNHVATHSKNQQFSCEHCGASFVSNVVLERHLAFHEAEKPFCCAHCPARFKQKSHLKDHFLAHSDKKAYSCGHCSIQYKRKVDYQKHLAKNHPESARKSMVQFSDCAEVEEISGVFLKPHSQTAEHYPIVELTECIEGEEILGI